MVVKAESLTTVMLFKKLAVAAATPVVSSVPPARRTATRSTLYGAVGFARVPRLAGAATVKEPMFTVAVPESSELVPTPVFVPVSVRLPGPDLVKPVAFTVPESVVV